MIDKEDSQSNSISNSDGDIRTTSDNKTISEKDPQKLIRFIGGNKDKLKNNDIYDDI